MPKIHKIKFVIGVPKQRISYYLALLAQLTLYWNILKVCSPMEEYYVDLMYRWYLFQYAFTDY